MPSCIQKKDLFHAKTQRREAASRRVGAKKKDAKKDALGDSICDRNLILSMKCYENN